MEKYTLRIQAVTLLTIIVFLVSGCASTTVIESYPSGAKLYINGESVGKTPYTYTDTKIVGSTNYVTLEKEGYQTFKTVFARNEEVDAGAIVGGILVLVPFLWTMRYKPVHTYELISGSDQIQPSQDAQTQPLTTKSKADELRELKKLLDEKIITQEEYEKEKKKILDE